MKNSLDNLKKTANIIEKVIALNGDTALLHIENSKNYYKCDITKQHIDIQSASCNITFIITFSVFTHHITR